MPVTEAEEVTSRRASSAVECGLLAQEEGEREVVMHGERCSPSGRTKWGFLLTLSCLLALSVFLVGVVVWIVGAVGEWKETVYFLSM